MPPAERVLPPRGPCLRPGSSPGVVSGMGRAVTPPQDRTAVAGRGARAPVFFCTGTCRDEWQEERAGPRALCLLAVSLTPEEWLRKGDRGGVLCAWMEKL